MRGAPSTRLEVETAKYSCVPVFLIVYKLFDWGCTDHWKGWSIIDDFDKQKGQCSEATHLLSAVILHLFSNVGSSIVLLRRHEDIATNEWTDSIVAIGERILIDWQKRIFNGIQMPHVPIRVLITWFVGEALHLIWKVSFKDRWSLWSTHWCRSKDTTVTIID